MLSTWPKIILLSSGQPRQTKSLDASSWKPKLEVPCLPSFKVMRRSPLQEEMLTDDVTGLSLKYLGHFSPQRLGRSANRRREKTEKEQPQTWKENQASPQNQEQKGASEEGVSTALGWDSPNCMRGEGWDWGPEPGSTRVGSAVTSQSRFCAGVGQVPGRCCWEKMLPNYLNFLS